MMTMGGPPGMFGLPPAKRDDGRVSEESYLELMRLVKALLKRVEALEDRTGLSQKVEVPCTFCNVLKDHQPWCESNAKRTSGT